MVKRQFSGKWVNAPRDVKYACIVYSHMHIHKRLVFAGTRIWMILKQAIEQSLYVRKDGIHARQRSETEKITEIRPHTEPQTQISAPSEEQNNRCSHSQADASPVREKKAASRGIKETND
jgi:hypothetical protein